MKPEEINTRKQIVAEANQIGGLNEIILKKISGAPSEKEALNLLKKYSKMLRKFSDNIVCTDRQN